MSNAAWPQNYVTKAFSSLVSVATTWESVVAGTQAQSTAYPWSNSAGLLITPSGAGNLRANNRSLNLSTRAKLGISLYIPTLPSGSPTLAVYVASDSGTSAANAQFYGWNINQLKQGQNFLTVDLGGSATTDALGISRSTIGTGANLSVTIQHLRIEWSADWNGVPFYLDGVWYGGRSRPCIMIGADALDSSVETYWLPMMEAYGWDGYLALNIPTAPPLETAYARTQTFYDAGFDVVNHTSDHTNLTTLVESAAIARKITDFRDYQLSHGWTRGSRIFAYPENAQNALTEQVVRSLGFDFCRAIFQRNIETTQWGVPNLFHVGSYDMGNRTLATLKTIVDGAILGGHSIMPFFHGVTAGGDGSSATGDALTIYETVLQAWLDYIRSKERQGLIDVVRPTDWYLGLTQPALAAS